MNIEKVILIHPEAFTERLEKFNAVYPSCLPAYEIPHALTGDEVTKPDWWVHSSNSYALYCNVKNIVSSLDKITLVLEDDCRFSDDFESKLNEFLADIPEDWDILNLGCYHKYNSFYKPYQVNPTCLRDGFIIMCHALIYNPNSKDKILDALDTDNWKNDYKPVHEYDYAYGYASIRNKLKIYSPIQNICGQLGEPSTLRDSQGAGHVIFFNDFKYRNLEGKIV